MKNELKQSPPDSADLMSLLVQIEQQSRESALRIPQVQVSEELWDGLAYSIAGVRVISSMNEIREMLPYPEQVTRVPGASEWMKGVANVRGNLLPVIDLQSFFGAKAVVPGKAARMLVVQMRGLSCGLLVPSVLGMRHFNEENRLDNAQMKGALGRYVYEAFSVEGEIWPVFSMSALTADPAFRSAAA